VTDSIELPDHLHTVNVHPLLYRIHSSEYPPLFFGKLGAYRFDAPDQEFGVLHAAADPLGAFVETCLRQKTGKHVPGVDRRSLQRKTLSTIAFDPSELPVNLSGPGLALNHANADVGAHFEYTKSQAYSAAVYRHPDVLAGIAYRGRHDNELTAILSVETPNSTLDKFDNLLRDIEERYGVIIY